MATGYYGPSGVHKLITQIELCIREWGDDPAYYTAAQKLREVARELDVLVESPGHRAAARAAEDQHTGQKPYKERGK